MKKGEMITAVDFRKNLLKIMPGYKWTVHESYAPETYLSATGIQSSGFNRISTLAVTVRLKKGGLEYTVKSSGFGKNAPWLGEASEGTLARALRTLQKHYEYTANNHRSHALALQEGRKNAENVEHRI